MGTIVPIPVTKQDAQIVINLVDEYGAASIRHEVLSLFTKDWRGEHIDVIRAKIKSCRNNPTIVTAMERLKITWEDLEKIAEEAKCDTQEH